MFTLGLTIEEIDKILEEAGLVNGARVDADTTRLFIAKAIIENNKKIAEQIQLFISHQANT